MMEAVEGEKGYAYLVVGCILFHYLRCIPGESRNTRNPGAFMI